MRVNQPSSTFRRVLGALSARDQQVLELREVLGLSADAIAAALGLSRAQAQVVLLDARRALARSLVHDLHSPWDR